MTGVTFDNARSKWRSSITINSRTIHLGYFDSYEMACASRREGERRYRPVKYELRPCPVCSKTIPNVSKRGNRLRRGHYDQKSTCGDDKCVAVALRLSRQGGIRFPVRKDEPYYQFCFGG